MKPTGAEAPENWYQGLDWARIAALAMVVFQHAMSVAGHSDKTHVAAVNIGQVGVAIFLAISGLLAADSKYSATRWLWRRLVRIFPAYWIAIVISFLLTWLSGYKPVSVGQFVSQMLGIGLYVGWGEMVNVATWFVSLLIACYGLAFLCKLTQHERFAGAALLITLIILAICDVQRFFVVHTISFVAAFVAGTFSNRRNQMIALGTSTAISFALTFFIYLFWYPTLAIVTVALFLFVKKEWKVVQFIASCSYEYYLIHGIFLVGAVRYLNVPVAVAIGAAILLAFIPAYALHLLAQQISRWILTPRLSEPAAKPTY